jgi:hypothetical protein
MAVNLQGVVILKNDGEGVGGGTKWINLPWYGVPSSCKVVVHRHLLAKFPSLLQ